MTRTELQIKAHMAAVAELRSEIRKWQQQLDEELALIQRLLSAIKQGGEKEEEWGSFRQ